MILFPEKYDCIFHAYLTLTNAPNVMFHHFIVKLSARLGTETL